VDGSLCGGNTLRRLFSSMAGPDGRGAHDMAEGVRGRMRAVDVQLVVVKQVSVSAILEVNTHRLPRRNDTHAMTRTNYHSSGSSPIEPGILSNVSNLSGERSWGSR
jgi:hypothetical protein